MTLLDVAAVLVSVAALFAYINDRFLKLPQTIGLMVISLVMSLGIMLAGKLGLGGIEAMAGQVLDGVDFDVTLMHGMLSFLLFAGALHVDLNDLLHEKWTVLILASVGVALSTALVGGAAWLVFDMIGLSVAPLYCFLFGAIISPTDPIAVLGILKSAGAPRSLEIKIAGESLFNDGFAVVIFLVLLRLATAGESVEVGHVLLLLVQETLGGVLFGLLLGGLAYALLRGVDNYQLEVLVTVAIVMGGYSLASAIHVSGPIAIVVAGLAIGNHGRMQAMSDRTREYLDNFWEMLDELLNAILFVLIGLEVLVLEFSRAFLYAAILMIPAVLLARFVAVGTLVGLLRSLRSFSRGVVWILTWGGLRGGVSVALALSLPVGPQREAVVAVTYIVVVFSVIVQGLTLGGLIRRIDAGG